MLTEEQKARIRRFYNDLSASLSGDQRKLIEDFWSDMKPTLNSLQQTVVNAVLGALR